MAATLHPACSYVLIDGLAQSTTQQGAGLHLDPGPRNVHVQDIDLVCTRSPSCSSCRVSQAVEARQAGATSYSKQYVCSRGVQLRPPDIWSTCAGLPADGTIAAEVAFMFNEWYQPNCQLDFPRGGSQAIIKALVRSGLWTTCCDLCSCTLSAALHCTQVVPQSPGACFPVSTSSDGRHPTGASRSMEGRLRSRLTWTA